MSKPLRVIIDVVNGEVVDCYLEEDHPDIHIVYAVNNQDTYTTELVDMEPLPAHLRNQAD